MEGGDGGAYTGWKICRQGSWGALLVSTVLEFAEAHQKVWAAMELQGAREMQPAAAFCKQAFTAGRYTGRYAGRPRTSVPSVSGHSRAAPFGFANVATMPLHTGLMRGRRGGVRGSSLGHRAAASSVPKAARLMYAAAAEDAESLHRLHTAARSAQSSMLQHTAGPAAARCTAPMHRPAM